MTSSCGRTRPATKQRLPGLRFLPLLLPALFFVNLPAVPQSLPSGFNYSQSAVGTAAEPDPLRFADGTIVHSRKQWLKRRQELLRLFEGTIFGRVPQAAQRLPVQATVAEADTPVFDGLATRRQVALALTPKGQAGPVLHLLLYLPHAGPPNRHSRRVPVIVGLNFEGNASVSDDPGILLTPVWQAARRRGDPPVAVTPKASLRGHQAGRWQVLTLLRRGYGLATAYYGDVEPDFPHAEQLGARGYFDSQADGPAAWGELAEWAWAMTLMRRYLIEDPSVDPHAIVATGFSRLGKAADWSVAQDQGFAALLSTESGKGGQSLLHRDFGETVAHLEHSFPRWFCPAFAQWVGRDAELPVDGNELLALIAPRPLYVSSAEGDLFSDPNGEFLSVRDVGRVYQLLGKQPLGTDTMPSANQPVGQGVLAYHMRTGKHDVTAYDWEQYLTFLDHVLPAK